MVFLFLLTTLTVAAIVAWFVAGWFVKAFQQYQRLFKQEAAHRLDEFFLFLDPAQLWVANLGLCTALFLVIYGVSGTLWLGLLAAVGALAAPQGIIARLRRRRLARFDEQLPDLLLALAGALRAGSGVQAALRHIVAQSPPPLGQEFGLMLREQRMGVAFDQALAQLYRRMPTEGMGLVVSALNIAVQSGGNLAETLERIATTLRSRLHLLGRVRALTSQGRMQAWVMACLPFLLALALNWLEPESMALLWHTPAGWAVIGTVLILELAGLFLIRRIVDIQV